MALSTTTTTPTGWGADAAFGNYQKAQQIAAQPYAPYGGNMLAGWNQGQQDGYNAVLNGSGVGMPAMQQAQGAALNAAQQGPQQVQGTGYNPAMRGVMNTAAMSAGNPWLHSANTGNAQQMGRGDIRNVQAGQFPGADLSQYMNPFTGAVIDTTMQQLGRQNDILQNQTNARASAAGAFGGSRQAIGNAENNRSFMDTAGRTIAGLNNQNFAQAQAAIQADQNRAIQADQMNQNQDWNVGQANLANRQGMELQNLANHQATGMANMLAGNQMSQFNANLRQGAENTTSAAHNQALADQAAAQNRAGEFNSDLNLRGQLANQSAAQDARNSQIQAASALSNMGLDEQTRALQAANAQFQMGQQRTAFDQSVYDNAYNQWAQGQNYPMTQLGILQQGLNGYNSGSTQTTPYYSNTGAQIAAGALGAGALGAGILQNGSSIVAGGKDLWNGLKGLF
jgi:hypothetical protein